MLDDTRITPDILKVAGVVVLGSIMSILDVTVVNVALPTFQTELSATGEPLAYSTVAWTATAYMLALAAVIPLTGWAADRFGTKRLYMIALGLFTAGSVLCALAWNIESLIGFRVLQGLGGGMLLPLGMTIMTRAAGPKRMGRVMAILGIPMLLGPIMGPILGGILIDKASWPWIFLINLPIGIAALIYAGFVLPRDRTTPSETLDVVGMLLMSPGLALLLYGISSIPGAGTVASPKVLVPGIIGSLLIAVFAVHSFRLEHPLLDLRLLRDRKFSLPLITLALFMAAFFGSMMLVPTYFQQVRGESVLMAGLLVAPQGIGAMISMPIAGSLIDRMPIGRIAPFGFALVLLGTAGVASNTEPNSPYWLICLSLFVSGLGMGSSVMPLFTAAMQPLKPKDVARGSTLLNVVQQVGNATGISVISVVLTNAMKSGPVLPGSDRIPGAEDGLTAAQLAASATSADGEKLIAALGVPARVLRQGVVDLAEAFQTSYWVGFAVLVLTLIPVALLPRKQQPAEPGDQHPPVAVH